MSYRLKLHEPMQKGFRRIAAEQFERAQARLASGHHVQETANLGAVAAGDPALVSLVHETRKSIKRLRALLRLMRPGLSISLFTEENARLRDVARTLSPLRDAEVAHITLKALLRELGHDVQRRVVNLAPPLPLTSHTKASLDTILSTARADVAASQANVARAKLLTDDVAIAAQGFEDTYRTGRRARMKAFATEEDEDFHAWRKCVQYHWRQVTLLCAAWPDVLTPQIAAARTLADLLGHDHDLALLTLNLKADAVAGLSPKDRAVVATHARVRQSRIRAHARILGDRLFLERPGDFRNRIEIYWRSAALLKSLDERDAEPVTSQKSAAKRHRVGDKT